MEANSCEHQIMLRKMYFSWIKACENASLCSALRPSTKREATKERKPLISVHYVPTYVISYYSGTAQKFKIVSGRGMFFDM